MLQPKRIARRATPWVVCGASGAYALQRAHRLSRADSSDATVIEFLLSQSDVILLMVGSQIVWYITARHQPKQELHMQPVGLSMSPNDQAIHQLHQVFSALMLGTGLLMRRIAAGRTADLAVLAMRLHRIVGDGVRVLSTLDGASEQSVWQRAAPLRQAGINGSAHEHGTSRAH